MKQKKKEGRKWCRCISIWIHGFWIAHISEIIQWLSSERHKQVIRAGRILLQTPSSLMAPPQFSPSTHILVSYRLTWLMHKSRRELLKPVKEEWGMFFLEPNLDMVHFSLSLFPTTCKKYVFINLTKSSAKENLMLQYPRMQSFIWSAHKYKWYSASTQTWACFLAHISYKMCSTNVCRCFPNCILMLLHRNMVCLLCGQLISTCCTNLSILPSTTTFTMTIDWTNAHTKIAKSTFYVT